MNTDSAVHTSANMHPAKKSHVKIFAPSMVAAARSSSSRRRVSFRSPTSGNAISARRGPCALDEGVWVQRAAGGNHAAHHAVVAQVAHQGAGVDIGQHRDLELLQVLLGHLLRAPV